MIKKSIQNYQYTTDIQPRNCQESTSLYISSNTHFSNFFVRTTLRALKYHKYAQRYINKDKLAKSFRWVQRCAPLADKLVDASTKMVKQSDLLKNMTEDAYLETQRNDLQNTGEIKKTSTYQIHSYDKKLQK